MRKKFSPRDAQSSPLNQNDVSDENFSLSVIDEREEADERRTTTVTR